MVPPRGHRGEPLGSRDAWLGARRDQQEGSSGVGGPAPCRGRSSPAWHQCVDGVGGAFPASVSRAKYGEQDDVETALNM